MKFDGKKIAILSTSLKFGGAEIFAINQANYLSSLGASVTLISLTPPARDVIGKVDPSIKILSFNLKKWFLFELWKLGKAISRVGPVAVHTHMIHANLIGRFCKVVLRENWKLFLTAHSEYEGVLSFLYRFFQVEDAFFHVSEGGLEHFKASRYCPAEKAFWLPNCTNVRSAKRGLEAGGERYFLWIGRMEAVKRLDLLILAYKKFLEMRPSCAVGLKLVGEGSQYSSISELVETVGLKNDVELVGFQERPEVYFKNAVGTVLVSKNEGLPSVLLESAQYGVPVVTTRSFFAPSFFKSIGNGYVIMDDSIIAVAEAFCEFLDSLELCSSHVNLFSAHETKSRFDCKSVFEGLSSFYE